MANGKLAFALPTARLLNIRKVHVTHWRASHDDWGFGAYLGIWAAAVGFAQAAFGSLHGYNCLQQLVRSLRRIRFLRNTNFLIMDI